MLTVKEDLKNAALEKGRSMNFKALDEQCEKHKQTMVKAAEESLEGKKPTCFGDNQSWSDINEQVIRIHSELAGYTDAYKEKEALDVQSRAIADANEGSPEAQAAAKAEADRMAAIAPRHRNRGAPLLSDHFREKVSADRLKQAASNPVTIQMDMPGYSILDTLFETTAGWEPESVRERTLILRDTRPIEVLDTIPSRPVDQPSVKYMEETSYSNAAGSVGEGVDYAGETKNTLVYPSRESTLALTERVVNVVKIGTYIPMTEEQLEDVPETDAYINDRIPHMVRQQVENQVIGGAGAVAATPTEMVGFTGRAGVLNQNFATTGTGANTVLTKGSMLGNLLQGINQVRRTSFTRPSAIWLRSEAWEDMVIAQLSATGYFFGNPQDGYAPRAWGLPVVEVTSGELPYSVPAATGSNPLGIIGDFRMFSVVRVRRDLEVRIGLVNDDFLRDQLTMKANVRAALVIYRPTAFVKMNWTRA